MFDRVDTRAQRSIDPIDTVGMGEHFAAERMGRTDDRNELIPNESPAPDPEDVDPEREDDDPGAD